MWRKFGKLQDLAERHREPELMDRIDLDETAHQQALAGLKTINALSATAGLFYRYLADLAGEMHGRPLRVLDLACGGGDTAIRLARMAERRRMAIEVDGCDTSSFAVRYAQDSARRQNVRAGFFRCDLLNGVPEGYDVLINSLFLHHLEREEAVVFLRAMSRAARRAIILTDLIRSQTGLVLVSTVPRVISRSSVVHVDAVRSLRAAFTVDEARQLAACAGLDNTMIRLVWPMRFLLTWRRP